MPALAPERPTTHPLLGSATQQKHPRGRRSVGSSGLQSRHRDASPTPSRAAQLPHSLTGAMQISRRHLLALLAASAASVGLVGGSVAVRWWDVPAEAPFQHLSTAEATMVRAWSAAAFPAGPTAALDGGDAALDRFFDALLGALPATQRKLMKLLLHALDSAALPSPAASSAGSAPPTPVRSSTSSSRPTWPRFVVPPRASRRCWAPATPPIRPSLPSSRCCTAAGTWPEPTPVRIPMPRPLP